jgi:hypothetical protein
VDLPTLPSGAPCGQLDLPLLPFTLHNTHFLQAHSGTSRQGVFFQEETGPNRCLPQIISYFISNSHDLTYSAGCGIPGMGVVFVFCVNIHTCTAQPSKNRERCKRGCPAIDVLLVGAIQLGIIVLIG